MEVIVFWLIAATVVAIIAGSKGYSAVGWWFYGLLIWPIALVHILVKERQGDARRSYADAPVLPVYDAPVRQSAASATPDLDRETFAVADAWRTEGRTFTMIEAKEEARLRLSDAARRR